MWPFKRKGGKTEQIQAYTEKSERLTPLAKAKASELKERLEKDEDISIKIFYAIRKADGK